MQIASVAATPNVRLPLPRAAGLPTCSVPVEMLIGPPSLPKGLHVPCWYRFTPPIVAPTAQVAPPLTEFSWGNRLFAHPFFQRAGNS